MGNPREAFGTLRNVLKSDKTLVKERAASSGEENTKRKALIKAGGWVGIFASAGATAGIVTGIITTKNEHHNLTSAESSLKDARAKLPKDQAIFRHNKNLLPELCQTSIHAYLSDTAIQTVKSPTEVADQLMTSGKCPAEDPAFVSEATVFGHKTVVDQAAIDQANSTIDASRQELQISKPEILGAAGAVVLGGIATAMAVVIRDSDFALLREQ